MLCIHSQGNYYRRHLLDTTFLTSLVASHRCIFRVDTVVVANAIVRAVEESCLVASAPNIIQIDRPSSWTKPSIREGNSIYTELRKAIVSNRAINSS